MTAPVSAETANIDAAREFFTSLGEHLSGTLIARARTARATLAQRNADTSTLALFDRIATHLAAMAATCTSGVEHLDTYHGNLEQAVNSTPEAADTDFYRPAATTPGEQPNPAPAANDSIPGTAEDEDEAYARAMQEAAAFIDATTGSHPQQAPPGKDLQHRRAEGDEDDEQPWMSLPVRSSSVCEHVDTVCSQCLEAWSWGHDLRVAEVPTSVDVDAHHATADEIYHFEGDPDRDLPPYWVARHDRTVTSQIADRPVSTILLADDDRASATFAGECCDTTPSGPGAPRPGDRIETSGEPGTGAGAAAVTISSSTPQGNGYLVKGTDQNGQPYEGVVDAWNYEIVHRPTHQQPARAQTAGENAGAAQ
ncbi:hypothetical protein [Paractinoplanes atraurantiacus]|uniref:Uncharacterized protein n=1 Tax=Paractinoplanes atraurantiacus TaxID=1036182 RepID=A0A285KM22_9ACTN|nr:hypothetical protein [Actinoplanes atraurantiacus]SNY72917.1 hypothetical protein SAMN05421748_14457 [Actinoplanes atraurantiacus]